jgi:hypothetical protein
VTLVGNVGTGSAIVDIKLGIFVVTFYHCIFVLI